MRPERSEEVPIGFYSQFGKAQIINSLKGSKQKVGLLLNFGELSLKFKRFVY
jgi:hypothetical protein